MEIDTKNLNAATLLHYVTNPHEPAMRTADMMFRTAIKAVQGVKRTTIIAMACHQYPGKTVEGALQAFAADVANAANALTRMQATVDAFTGAEIERLRPYTEAAASRALAITARLGHMDRMICAREADREAKHNQLIAMGVKPADADKIADEQSDASGLRAQKARMNDELAAIERFQKSRDTNDLPESFLANVEAYRTMHGASRFSEAA